MNSKQFCLGIDTSNYTTSAALVDEDGRVIADARKVLEVPSGERGLRQSQALFEHIGNLPEVFEELYRRAEEFPGFDRRKIRAVAVSERPRPRKDSYMPVFRAGISHGEAIAKSLGVPCFRFSHQEGHLAAVLPGSGLAAEEFLAMHLSGGTTEVLLCRKRNGTEGPAFDIGIVGGTKDLSFGQVIDRAGVALGRTFPCGKEMDRAAMEYKRQKNATDLPVFCRVKSENGEINLSGIETQIRRYIEEQTAAGSVRERMIAPLAAALFDRIAEALREMTAQCRKKTGITPVLISGGVASSRYLREELAKEKDWFFGEPALSPDNAVGTAVLGMQRWQTISERNGSKE